MAEDQDRDERLRQARERAQQWRTQHGGQAPARPPLTEAEREDRARQARERAEAARREREAQTTTAVAAPPSPAAPAPSEPAAAEGEGAAPPAPAAAPAAPPGPAVTVSRREPPPSAATAPGIPIARPEAARRVWSRRDFIRAGFWSGLGLSTLLSGLALWNLIWQRKVTGFGSVMTVTREEIPAAGDPPKYIIQGKFYLVNLKPGEGAFGEFGKPSSGGLLALYQKCPHLGCRVPWDPNFVYTGSDIKGWFRCPCHGSTYTKAGIRVFGPAPRPMDTMGLTVISDGSVEVDTGRITTGNVDNPTRTVALSAAFKDLWGRLRSRI